ncbi:MAG: undecaprenyl-phosphate glucose phosphotransferase [Bacteroidales bacterium]
MEQRKGYGYLINFITVGGEFVLLNSLFITALYLFRDMLNEEVWSNKPALILWVNVAYIPTIFFYYQKFHEQRILFSHRLLANAARITLSHFFVFLSLMLLMKFVDLSRTFVAIFYLVFFCTLFCWWFFVWFMLKRYRKSGYNFKNVALVGSGKNIEDLYTELTAQDAYGYRVLGYFDKSWKRGTRLKPYLGDLDSMLSYMHVNQVDELYCGLMANENPRIAQLMNYCENNMIRFYIVPCFDTEISRTMKLELLGTVPVMIPRKEPLNDLLARFIKRSFDILFALMVLLIAPLWYLPIAVAVKLSSPGPVLFKQLRTGRGGKDFWCYKFRSMHVNDAADTLQATKDDPRKTVIGDFLRRTNLDELPQFINILKGEMSVVGPRPHMLKHTHDYSRLIDKYMVRHYVKPGLTGWAQVNGYRGETREEWQMEKRVEYDLWYLENWSFWLDMKIIAQTSVQVFKPDDHAF